jgi:predicted dienelactone hydrolase
MAFKTSVGSVVMLFTQPLAALTFPVALSGAAWLQQADAAVGFEEVRISNGDEPPLVGGIWYPTTAQPGEHALETYSQTVAPSGPVKGHALPLVVLSHGGGGSYAGHFDTALALARAGFVTASVSHAGDTYDDQSKVLRLWRRPAQLSRLIDYMLTDWSDHTRIDRRRVGAFGFSNGGFTVLVEAGGIPDLMRIDPYCKENPEHDLCVALREAGFRSVAAIQPPLGAWKADARVRAIAMAAPAFGFTFDRAGLASVKIPVQIWRGADDRHQPTPWYEERIRTALPRAPDYKVVPDAGHYAFLPPCSDSLRQRAPELCTDRIGFDRAAFHRRFNAELVRFFRAALR